MKKIILTSFILSIATICNAQTGDLKPADTKIGQSKNMNVPNAPKFKFKEKDDGFDFGNIAAGLEVVHVFEFTNVGKTPLIIQGCMTSCGCTTTDWPKEPIFPGKTGKITVKYNSAGHVGEFTKYVFITSNAATESENFVIHITGKVAPIKVLHD